MCLTGERMLDIGLPFYKVSVKKKKMFLFASGIFSEKVDRTWPEIHVFMGRSESCLSHSDIQ